MSRHDVKRRALGGQFAPGDSPVSPQGPKFWDGLAGTGRIQGGRFAK